MCQYIARDGFADDWHLEIGRASCRERGEGWVGGGDFKKRRDLVRVLLDGACDADAFCTQDGSDTGQHTRTVRGWAPGIRSRAYRVHAHMRRYRVKLDRGTVLQLAGDGASHVCDVAPDARLFFFKQKTAYEIGQ